MQKGIENRFDSSIDTELRDLFKDSFYGAELVAKKLHTELTDDEKKQAKEKLQSLLHDPIKVESIKRLLKNGWKLVLRVPYLDSTTQMPVPTTVVNIWSHVKQDLGNMQIIQDRSHPNTYEAIKGVSWALVSGEMIAGTDRVGLEEQTQALYDEADRLRIPHDKIRIRTISEAMYDGVVTGSILGSSCDERTSSKISRTSGDYAVLRHGAMPGKADDFGEALVSSTHRQTQWEDIEIVGKGAGIFANIELEN